MTAGRIRTWAANLALLAASTAAFLLVAEAAVRAFGWAPQYGPMAWVSNTEGSVKPGTIALLGYPTNPRGYFPVDLHQEDTRRRYEQLGVRHLAEVVKASPYAIEYRFNSLALRGREAPARRPGVSRIAVVGDSFTLGWGVREEDAGPVVLTALLQGKEYEAVNCGRAGADFPLLTTVFEKALRVDPDVVVYAMVLNDPDRSDQMVEQLRAGALRGANNLFVPGRAPGPPRPLLGSRLAALVAGRIESRRTRDQMVRWHLGLYGEANHRGWSRTRDAIRAMADTMHARGGRFVLALWPLLADLDGDYPFQPAHDEVSAFCRRANIPFHDLLPAFRGRRAADLWAHPIDRHPNAEAQRIFARSLASALPDLLD
jgi:lysophospholipase L1-like esterase